VKIQKNLAVAVPLYFAGALPWQLFGTLGKLNLARLPHVSQPPSAKRAINPKTLQILRFTVSSPACGTLSMPQNFIKPFPKTSAWTTSQTTLK
jgi:hypothetical protein